MNAETDSRLGPTFKTIYLENKIGDVIKNLRKFLEPYNVEEHRNLSKPY